MDLDVEIAKCDKKLGLAKLNLEKVRKVESQADYEETVPENVRLINEEKVCGFPFLSLHCLPVLIICTSAEENS